MEAMEAMIELANEQMGYKDFQRSQMLYCLSVQHTEKHHSWELYTVYFYYFTTSYSCTIQWTAVHNKTESSEL